MSDLRATLLVPGFRRKRGQHDPAVEGVPLTGARFHMWTSSRLAITSRPRPAGLRSPSTCYRDAAMPSRAPARPAWAKLPKRFPRAVDPSRVGSYPALTFAGGGYVWDEVLEYRVFCHRDDGDFFRAFASYPRALAFSRRTPGAEEPLALILQRQYIDEPRRGHYVHVKKRRVTEWPVEFLSRPRRDRYTIEDFLSPHAPRNRLAILRGLAKRPRTKSIEGRIPRRDPKRSARGR